MWVTHGWVLLSYLSSTYNGDADADAEKKWTKIAHTIPMWIPYMITKCYAMWSQNRNPPCSTINYYNYYMYVALPIYNFMSKLFLQSQRTWPTERGKVWSLLKIRTSKTYYSRLELPKRLTWCHMQSQTTKFAYQLAQTL